MWRALLLMIASQLVAQPTPAESREEPRPSRVRSKRLPTRSFDLDRAPAGSASSRVIAGSVEFLGMDRIRETVGPAWETVAGVAHDIAEEVIERHLSAGDEFRRRGENIYLLKFATLGKPEAAIKTAEIAKDIRQTILERVPESGLRVRHDIVDIEWVDGDIGIASIADTMAESLRKVREEAKAAASLWRRNLLAIARFHYDPMWMPAKKLVAHYRVLLDEETGK